ncbi:MAG: biotin/lipoyl-binding protein [Pseudomonadota bacterium]|nr:biotin/lipoyl-binding protein [Pseudomonadota bacterium]MDO7667309.1 biotin/lipoyl-binding protein [Pseudomonadota bacterium]MDO7710100.1 biotin/lipoyl-binding protein [Pseudomonadota bacterium]
MLKRVVYPLVIVLVAIATFMGLKQSKPEKVVIEQPEKIWRVNTVPVNIQQVSPEITLYGRVETPRNSTLKSALDADVLSIEVLEGVEVTAGQLLLTLDDTDMQLSVLQRQADLAEIEALMASENQRFKRDQSLLEQQTALLQLADNVVNRSKKLEQSRLASQATLDDAQASKQRQLVTLKGLNFDIAEHPARQAKLQAQSKRAQAFLRQAEVDVERTKITAPFSGRISLLSVSIGDRVRPGDTLISLYDLDNLEVRAQIPGRYIDQVNKMLSHREVLEAKASLNNNSLAFKLERLSGEVKVDSGGLDGLFSISGNQYAIALGTFIELKLKLAQQNDIVAVPFNALYGLDHVYRLKDGYLQSVAIERVGESTNDQGQKKLLLRSQDLRQGDQIVSTQLPNAITGLRVEALSE